MPRPLVAMILALAILLPILASAAPGEEDAARDRKTGRLESDLSIGSVSNGRLGIVKSIWFYAVPKVLSFGLSFDFVAEFVPFSVGICLNAPIPYVVPFVYAAAGTSLTIGGITHFGGGLKFRLGRRFGLIAEYRRYRYTRNVAGNPPLYEKDTSYHIGAGISWIY